MQLDNGHLMMKVGGVPLDVDIDDESLYAELAEKPSSIDAAIESMDENEDVSYPVWKKWFYIFW